MGLCNQKSALNEWAWSKGGKNRTSHLSVHSRMANWEASVLNLPGFLTEIEAAVAISSRAGHSSERWGVWVSSPSALLQHLGFCRVCQRHLCPEDHHLPVIRQQKSSWQKR